MERYMSETGPVAHPYMANSVPAIKQEMLAEAGAATIEELFEQIPSDHRLKRPMELPRQLRSEVELRRHLQGLLVKNSSCEENLSFLGGGCWQHYVPAICDEMVGRAEFATPVLGTPSSEHGRNQTQFEFSSLAGELINMDYVGLPVYSWACAGGHAIRMASRLNGRSEVLIPRSIAPDRLSVIRNYCEPVEMASHIDVTLVDYDAETGQLDLADLRRKLSERTAAIYFDNPNFLGLIESNGGEISELAHQHGAEVVVGVDPSSLGVLRAPADYGADIVAATMQPLGVHMNCGGGSAGFIASRDEERYVREYPTLVMTIAPTSEPGEHGFGNVLVEQTSYGSRDQGKDWTGNSTYLWTVAGAVYMSLMGPAGFRELGQLILQRSHYAARALDALPGVRVTFPNGFFKEFVVNFDKTGRTVSEINARLRRHGIFGGKDLSADFPELGQAALYCITEVHSQTDIDRLIEALREETMR
jgi:glycine dehydrogenase subunit 1